MKHYSITIIDISNFSRNLEEMIFENYKTCGIFVEELEDCFDWILEESLTNILRCEIKGHYVNDKFNFMYEIVKTYIDQVLLSIVENYGLVKLKLARLGLLITARDMIICFRGYKWQK